MQKAPSVQDVSVVIPTYKRPHLALKAASVIRSFHPEVQITVVDQAGSSPISSGDLKRLRIDYFNLTHDNTSNAKNKGIKNSKGDIVFFFDDDVEITASTIPEQLKKYEDPGVAGTCGRVINDGEEVPENPFVDTGRTNFLGTFFSLNYWSTKPQTIDFPYGCNMSFRKDALGKSGGFDPRFPKIFEEVDLGVRISRNIGKIAFVPKALAYHHKAPSGGTRTNIENKFRMIYLHYGKYLGKNVPFPLSLVPLLLRTRTALVEAPYALKDLYNGYRETVFQ